MSDLAGMRIVAVHAHPDDEAIWTGGVLANAASRGAEVTVVTCTLGEQGEVIGEPFQGLVADASDQLGGFRIRELEQSLSILGVRGEYLGHVGKYRDSGMIGDAANSHSRAFISSGEDSVTDIIEVFERIKPHVVVTYGPDGGYGHPDHVRAHNIVHEAQRILSERGHDYIQRILWAVTGREALERGLAAITTPPEGWREPLTGEIACVDQVDVTISLGHDDFERKRDAMKAHATQLWIADGSTSAVNPHAATAEVADSAAAPAVFALSNLIAQPLLSEEHYQVGFTQTPLTGDTDPWEGITW